MRPRIFNLTTIFLAICLAIPAWGENAPSSSNQSQITEIPLSDLKLPEAGKNSSKKITKKGPVAVKTGNASSAMSAQNSYKAAVKKFKKGDYHSSLELFDRFLSDYPGSPLAADASLYKAECFLKLSNH